MTLNFLEKNKGNGDKLGNCRMTLIHLSCGLTNGTCYSISRKVNCLHAGHGNTGLNYYMGGAIPCKTVNEMYLGVTIYADMKVPEQCRIAAYQGSQIPGMIGRNIT